MKPQFNSHIYKGFFIATLYIVLDVTIMFLKVKNNQIIDFIAWIIIIAGTALSVHLFGKAQNNTQKFGSLFAHGFKTSAVATCLIFIYVLLVIYIINPDVITEKANEILADAQKNKLIGSTDTEANIFRENAIKVTRLLKIAGTVMGILFLGLMGSIIGAVATSKNNVQIN